LAENARQRTLCQLNERSSAVIRHIEQMERMNGSITLTDDDVAFLINVLRSSGLPLTTQQLIDALRERSARG
jgi:hypothetical protein